MARAAIPLVLTIMLLSYVQTAAAQLQGLKIVEIFLLPILDDIKANVSNLEETVSSLASQQNDIEAKLDSLDTKQGSLDIKQQELNTKLMSVSSTVSSLVSKQDDIEAKLYSVGTKQDQLNIRVMSVSSELKQNVSSEVKKTYDLLFEHVHYTCGSEGGWRRVVFLNTADLSTTTCPSGWNLITDSPKRTCGRFNDYTRDCISVFFPVTGGNYTKVCGSIRAYQYRSPAAFQPYYRGSTTIDDPFVDGVILTHGNPRQHIWTFAAGANEFDPNKSDVCPCDAAINNEIDIPPFVGEDYFCESGDNVDGYRASLYFEDDPLWDGEGCTSSSRCCEFNNPPYFTKQLSSPTTDDIEARLCRGRYDIDIPIEFMELYVK